MAKAKGKSTKPAAAAVVEDEDPELEVLEEDTPSETAPAKKAGGAQAVTFGVADIVKHLTSKGHKVDTRGIRTLIRKMARDGSNRVEREIVAGNRTRYDWPKGLKDPEVKKIIAAFEGGELEADKQEKLAALKERKANKDKADGKVKGKKNKAGKTKAKAKAAAPADDEDLELDD